MHVHMYVIKTIAKYIHIIYTYTSSYTQLLVIAHSVKSNDGTEDINIIISNSINIDVTKRITTEQTVYTAYTDKKKTKFGCTHKS